MLDRRTSLWDVFLLIQQFKWSMEKRNPSVNFDQVIWFEHHTIPSYIVSTEMMFMLDQQRFQQGFLPNLTTTWNKLFYFLFLALFYQLRTNSGHEIRLTSSHLISIYSSTTKNEEFVPSRNIEVGDELFVFNVTTNQIQRFPVVYIGTTIEMVGYYASLTTEGKPSYFD